MRVIWRLISAALAIVFLAGLFTSLAGKRKSVQGAAAPLASREFNPANELEAARWGARLAPPASRLSGAARPARRRRPLRRRRTRF